jgi:hypothetical protein
VLKDAIPPLSVAVPSEFEPSRNCTVPAAAEGLTVAVNVTPCPATDGLSEDATVTLARAFVTLTITAADVPEL